MSTVKPKETVNRQAWTVVTVSELVHQLRAEPEDYQEGSDMEAQLIAAIMAATGWLESYTGQSIIDGQYRVSMDVFPRGRGEILLPDYPVRSVDTVIYTDTTGQDVTIENSELDVDLHSYPVKIKPGSPWPATRQQFNSVRVTYTAGYVDQDSVPDALNRAALMLSAHLDSNALAAAPVNLNEVPFGVIAMANTERKSWL